jgi:diguanylate cyclase (GGDEF)-like protein
VNEETISVLMVEDNVEYSQLLRESLTMTGTLQFDFSHAPQLHTAIGRLAERSFDVILLDLSLPDSRGLDTFAAVHDHALGTPILVLTADNDDDMAIQAVRDGAQDYLIKGQLGPHSLARAIRNAIARQRAREAFERLSLLDELTGLYNRRGFYSLANQHIKLSRRTGRKLLLLFADMDGLKQINDTLGHQAGDLALQTAAELLQATFRTSDVVCRLGGDEFMILAIDAREGGAIALGERLQAAIDSHNAHNHHPPLELSWGVACYDPGLDTPLETLVSQADQALYEHKREKGETRKG